jgi:hypothetical protein
MTELDHIETEATAIIDLLESPYSLVIGAYQLLAPGDLIQNCICPIANSSSLLWPT